MLTNRATIQHAFAALIMILATLAGALLPAGHTVQPAAAQYSVFTAAALFEDANFAGAGTFFETSQPDLSTYGWANRISSIRVIGGMVIAAYSGTNYTGACEPFIGEDPWLGNNPIGNDTIQSIKLNATCEGVVFDPVVVDMTTVASSSNSVDDAHCPYDYVEKGQDLNQGIGGRYIRMCLKMGWRGDRNFVHDMFSGSAYNVDPGDDLPDNFCGDGRFLGVDLNLGAGARYRVVNYCIYSGGQEVSGNFEGAAGLRNIVLRDVEFIVYQSDSRPSYPERQALCERQFIDVVNGDVPVSAVKLSGTDLNQPIDFPVPGFEFNHTVIEMCVLSYERLLQPDPIPPIITLISRTPANADGWNNTAVTLTWKCTDYESGPLQETVSQTVSTEGTNQSATGICGDYGDNTVSDTQTSINIDLTPPTIALDGRTPPANAAGWNNTSVALHWACDDALSGPAFVALSRTVIEDGANQSIPALCRDKAGNTALDTQMVSIDRVAPAISFVGQTPVANAYGWINTAVELQWSCTDSLSGALEASVFRTIPTEGSNLSAAATCEDLAGNQVSAEQDGVNIDLTKPQLSLFARTPANRNGWNNTTVHVEWTCTDGLSGLASYTAFQIVSSEGAGQSSTGVCEDQAGNTATSTQGDINIDKTAPVVSFEAHAGSYLVDELVVIPCSASDGLSGIDVDCQGVSSPAYLFQLGPNTVTTSATDMAGNVGNASTSFDLEVTVESLASLHEIWVSDPDVVESLNEKAQNIANAPNDNARSGMLRGYERQLYKRATPEHAAILLRLVQGL